MRDKVTFSILRILLLPVVFFIILAPFTIYILPILSISVVKVSTTLACFYLFLIFFIGLFFGRAYCYYICPITALFLNIAKLTKNNDILKQNYPKWLSRFFIAAWFIAFSYLIYQLCFVSNEIYHYVPVIVLYSLLLVACVLSLLLIRNEANHPMCPIIPLLITGTMVAKRIGLPHLQVKADSKRCTSCKACSKACLASLNVNKLVKANSLGTTQQCYTCGCCSRVCKFGAIKYKFGKEF